MDPPSHPRPTVYVCVCVLQWEVCVSAVDGGGRSSTVLVTLSVVDVNDSPPRFTQSAYTFGTYENQPPDTEVGRLTAVDADRPPHDRHVFSLTAEVYVIQRSPST